MDGPASLSNYDDLVSCDPVQIMHDETSGIVDFQQTLHIRMPQEAIENALRLATDKQLKDELQFRADARKAMKSQIIRCKDCEYCGEGYCNKRPSLYKTTVCMKRPKPQAGEDRYYATNFSSKACAMFKQKNK